MQMIEDSVKCDFEEIVKKANKSIHSNDESYDFNFNPDSEERFHQIEMGTQNSFLSNMRYTEDDEDLNAV